MNSPTPPADPACPACGWHGAHAADCPTKRSRKPNRAQRRAQERERRALKGGPLNAPLSLVPAHELAETARRVDPPLGFRRMWRSAALVVFECERPGGLLLLMVQRVDARDEGITWDLLQWVKRQVGLSANEALELFPADEVVVNVANMRHLWVLPAGRQFPFGLDAARRAHGLEFEASGRFAEVSTLEELADRMGANESTSALAGGAMPQALPGIPVGEYADAMAGFGREAHDAGYRQGWRNGVEDARTGETETEGGGPNDDPGDSFELWLAEDRPTPDRPTMPVDDADDEALVVPCEGCKTPAIARDSDGTPLCADCYDALPLLVQSEGDS